MEYDHKQYEHVQPRFVNHQQKFQTSCIHVASGLILDATVGECV